MNCSACGDLLGVKNKNGKCKACYKAAWYESNKERLRKQGKKYREENKNKIRKRNSSEEVKKRNRDRRRKQKEENPEKFKKQFAAWAQKNRDKIIENRSRPEIKAAKALKSKERYSKDIENQRKKGREKAQLLKNERKENLKRWRKNNPEKFKAQCARRRAKPLSKVKTSIGNAIRRALNNLKIKKVNSCFALLGYTNKDLLAHSAKFLGKPCGCGLACDKTLVLSPTNSHLDHRTPLNEAKTEEDIARLNQLPNIWWICASCNLSKNCKIIEEFAVPLEVKV